MLKVNVALSLNFHCRIVSFRKAPFKIKPRFSKKKVNKNVMKNKLAQGDTDQIIKYILIYNKKRGN